jgi:hypothetical protein
LATRVTALGSEVSITQEQDVFNAAAFFPSYGGVVSVGVMRRTLNYLCFANSKTLFLFMRKDQQLLEQNHIPEIVDFSYHPGNLDRARDTYAYFDAVKTGSKKAATEQFMRWSSGAGIGAGDDSAKLCAMQTSSPTADDVAKHALATRLRNEEWAWAGTAPFKFENLGELVTPWGKGSWSLVKEAGGYVSNALWADFVGAHHLLRFETPEGSDEENTVFVSERCSDGNLVIGRRIPAKEGEV